MTASIENENEIPFQSDDNSINENFDILKIGITSKSENHLDENLFPNQVIQNNLEPIRNYIISIKLNDLEEEEEK